MLESLARRIVLRPVAALLFAPVLLVLGAVCAVGIFERLPSGGYDAPEDESSLAAELLAGSFDAGPANLVLLVDAPAGVDAPEVVAAGAALTAAVASEPGVTSVQSYWTPQRPEALAAADGRSALVLARLAGDDEEVRSRLTPLVDRLQDQRSAGEGAVEVRIGGRPATVQEIVEQSERDLRRSELAASPLVMLCLLLVFGGAVAAALPLAVGLVAVLGTLFVLTVLSLLTPVSVFALNLTTALGFGLAVDYGLFVVTRFREELDAGRPVDDAVVTTVTTAGRTVLVSALTVAVSLASLLVFPMYYLRSFAYGGIAVVALAAAVAIVVLPALLSVLGPRVDAWPVRALLTRRGRHTRPPDPAGRPRTGSGFWHRLAWLVMRRPVPVALAVIGVLVVLGLPFAQARFGLPDDRRLPASSEPHLVAERLRSAFPAVAGEHLFVVVPRLGSPVQQHQADLDRYAAALSAVPAVERVDGLTGSYAAGVRLGGEDATAGRFVSRTGDGTWLQVTTRVDADTAGGQQLVRDARAVPAPAQALIGGSAAELVDAQATLGRRLPIAMALVASATLVLLFLFTGSVLIPVKAVVLNLLSLTAAFGVLVWGFQEGHLRGLVGDFQVTGTLDLMTPLLMFCIAFGLSMDYEVFLLSRIKEEYDRSGDNEQAVAIGLQRTGRIITSAAAVVIVVLLALATSGLPVLKMLGVGLALAVLVDATLVRGLLVPAFMRLAGRANWWAPEVLRRVHRRVGLSESGPGPAAEPVRAGQPPEVPAAADPTRPPDAAVPEQLPAPADAPPLPAGVPARRSPDALLPTGGCR